MRASAEGASSRKERDGKWSARQRTAGGRRLDIRGLSARRLPAMVGKKRAPPEWSGGVVWTEGRLVCVPARRVSPRACLNRQAGSATARPAANSTKASAAVWSWSAIHNLEARGRPYLARRVGAGLQRGADCGLEDWSGGFRQYAAGKIGPASRGSSGEEDRRVQVPRDWRWA